MDLPGEYGTARLPGKRTRYQTGFSAPDRFEAYVLCLTEVSLSDVPLLQTVAPGPSKSGGLDADDLFRFPPPRHAADGGGGSLAHRRRDAQSLVAVDLCLDAQE